MLTEHELRLLREAHTNLQAVRRIESDLALGSIRKLKQVEELLAALHNIHHSAQKETQS